ncbi:MAG: flagellar biosynthetic protein FliR [Pseudomonadota bacterium]
MPYGDLINSILDLIGDYVPWVVLAVARPFGFTLLFAVFAWAKLDSAILRMAFAVGIALPMLANGVPTYGVEDLQLPFLIVLIKEIMIGAILGLIASIPLAIAMAGGGIIDIYRGALDAGGDPSGGAGSVYGMLFSVVTLWLFANIGGFQIITAAIYSSYDVWQVNAPLPEFRPGADALLNILEKILLGAIVLAGPLLIIMFFSDIVHLISAKFGKQINITHLAFSSKNLIAAMVLPLFLLVAVRFFKNELTFLYDIIGFAEGIFA